MRATLRAPAGALALLALCLAGSGCLFRAATGEPPVAGDIHVEGNHAVDEDTLLGRLALTGSGRWFFGLSEAHTYDPDALPADTKRIERIYQSLGYYAARVVDVKLREHDGREDVTFVVQEGPPTLVTNRKIDGLEGLPAQIVRDVMEDLPLKEGQVLVEAEYDRLKLLLRDRLRSHGYMSAAVDGRVVVDRQRASADVALEVAPGDQLRAGRIFVSGAQGISRDRVIMQSGISQGDLITPEKLTEAQKQVYAMGVFTLVQVEPAAAESKGVAPVVITVHEAPFIAREAGVGFVTDPNRSVAQVRGQWQHKNLARGLQQLTVSGTLGYALVPGLLAAFSDTGLQDHGFVGGARVEFVQPRVLRSPLDVSTAVDYTKDIYPAFSFQRVGGRVGFPAHLDMLLRNLTWTTNIGYDWYFKVSSQSTIPVGTTSAFATSGCGPATGGGSVPNQCVLGYIEGLLNLDRRDNPISAHKGFFVSASAQYAGLPGSEFDYVRISPEVRGYVPITERTTLALRVRWGMMFTVGCEPGQPKTDAAGNPVLDAEGNKVMCETRGQPGVSKFFAGGANSVRVMGSQQIGPRDFLVDRNGDFDTNKDVSCFDAAPGQKCKDPFTAGPPIPAGGNRLLEGSLELRMPTPWENLGWVLFFDIGAVSNVLDAKGALQETNTSNLLPDWSFLRYGAGIGFRYQTPVGPIRLDFANRLQSWGRRKEQYRPSTIPVTVRTTEKVELPPSQQNASLYTFSTDCKKDGYDRTSTNSTNFHQCYEEGGYLWGFQFFLTIGEAF